MDLMFNHIHQDLGRLRRLGQHSRGSLLESLGCGPRLPKPSRPGASGPSPSLSNGGVPTGESSS